MSTTDIRQNTDRRLYHPFQCTHLPHLRNTRLENSQFRFFGKLPHRQWNTNLRIITTRRTDNTTVRTQQLVQPLFHNGFSIASGDTDYRNIKPLPMYLSQFLQCFQRVRNDEEIESRGEIES